MLLYCCWKQSTVAGPRNINRKHSLSSTRLLEKRRNEKWAYEREDIDENGQVNVNATTTQYTIYTHFFSVSLKKSVAFHFSFSRMTRLSFIRCSTLLSDSDSNRNFSSSLNRCRSVRSSDRLRAV